MLGRFARQHPRVRVEARAERNDALIDRVGAGRLDLALAWGEPDGPRAERLASLPIRWIGPAGRDPSRLTGEPLPLVAFEPPCRFRDAGVAALDAAGIPWRLAFTSPSLTGLWAAVAAGLGVSLRTSAGLPASVRALSPEEAGLPRPPGHLAVASRGGGGPVAGHGAARLDPSGDARRRSCATSRHDARTKLVVTL